MGNDINGYSGLLDDDLNRIRSFATGDEIGRETFETPLESLKNLKDALTRVEDYKMNELTLDGAGRQEIGYHHEHFASAHSHVDSILRLHEQIQWMEEKPDKTKEEEINTDIARIALKYNYDRLGQVLKEDVINSTLVGYAPQEAPMISGGEEVTEHRQQAEILPLQRLKTPEPTR